MIVGSALLNPYAHAAGFGNFIVDGADFDGTNDYMLRGAGLDGAADSKLGIFSAWIRLDGGDATQMDLTGAPTAQDKFKIARGSDNKFFVGGRSAAGTLILFFGTAATFVASASWIHLLMSWDMAGGAGGRHLYINDVSDISVTTFTDDTVVYTGADWSIGATPVGTRKLNGCLAEVYFAPGQYLDFSVEANRRKFRSAAGKPVNLGTDGSIPTGTAPIILQHLGDGEAVANFATNRGSGGNFTITGTLDTASTSPSD